MLSNEEYDSIFTGTPRITPAQFIDWQVENLLNLGIAERSDADVLAGKTFGIGYSLWIPRHPKPDDFRRLVRFVTHYDPKMWLTVREGISCIDRNAGHADLIPAPEGPYLCVNIEDGRGRMNRTAAEHSRDIAADGRIPYQTAHAIFHGISFPMALGRHYFRILGSRCGMTGVPALRLRGGWPLLDLPNRADGDADVSGGDYDIASPHYGAPSFATWQEL